MECAENYDVSDDALRKLTETKDVTIINPCYYGCVAKKTGFVSICMRIHLGHFTQAQFFANFGGFFYLQVFGLKK